MQAQRLGPILLDEAGKRYDRPLDVRWKLVGDLKSANLCNWLYLRGECSGCPRNHARAALSDQEFDALWFVARQGRCYKDRKGGCPDPKCIYGHGQSVD